ncbi:MAG: filamentous hemagglutinin N-terminal domain-containing protein, partial [Elsteraceae bacterium]
MNEIVTKLLASTAAIALAAFSPAALAQSPQGATVAAGSIAVSRQGSTTVVTQGTERGVIDWRSFSIGAGEAVRFDQPGRSSVTLNRVTGSELSRIDGNLSATGQVWLSNPNGVLIGQGGQVNVGGLLATTGRIDAMEFLRSGRAAIDQIGKEAGIANLGTINIAEGGYAALAAASIRNEGVIAARAGSVALGAGKAMTVDFAGDKLITFLVTEALDQAPAGDTMISNGGAISAGGGTVLMSARAAKGVIDNVINLKGHVVANSVKIDGGTVSFGDGGLVQVSGKIDASSDMGKGGQVAVLGEKVGLMDGAAIDASGATGGGGVLVGGDWQGKGSVQNALAAYVAPTAVINVDATMAGDGGKAVVWADDAARFNGSISARGGVLAGNGGQVETSGK